MALSDSPPGPAGPAAPPALDIEAGVARLMGNRSLYLRTLARFRKDYRDAGATLRAALDAGDLALARRLAHTLKGAAAMIAAPGLHAAALALEEVLKTGTGTPHAPLLRIDRALDRVLREIGGMALTGEADPPQLASSPDLMVRLRRLLDIGDGAAVDLMETAGGALRDALGTQRLSALQEAVADFDYEGALELLDRPERAGEEDSDRKARP